MTWSHWFPFRVTSVVGWSREKATPLQPPNLRSSLRLTRNFRNSLRSHQRSAVFLQGLRVRAIRHVMFVSLFVCLFEERGGVETGSLSVVVLAVLELALLNRLTSNLQRSSCFCLPSAGAKGLQPHARLNDKVRVTQEHTDYSG